MNWHFLVNTWLNWVLSIKILLSTLTLLTSFFRQQIPFWHFHLNVKWLQMKFWMRLLFLRKRIHCLVLVFLENNPIKVVCTSPVLNQSIAKILQTCCFGYFGHAWLWTPKVILSSCRNFLCLSAGNKSTLSPMFFGDIAKICKIFIFGTLCMTGYSHPKW